MDYRRLTDRDEAARLRKLDSAVVLERLDSTASSHAFLRQDTSVRSAYTSGNGTGDGDGNGDVERAQDAAPIALDLSIRFGRLGLVTVVAVGLLMALTVTFKRGVVLGHFDPTANTTSQKQLLDDYNSYTGTVASLFGKPIELFVALAVQLVLLRVLAASVLRAEMSWKVDALVLVLSAGVGFLLNNSLNALNVQVQPPRIHPVISAADLHYTPEFSTVNIAERSTNLTHTVSERTDKNPITNTALRNLILPRVPVAKPYCDWGFNQDQTGSFPFPDLVLEYGFSQRDWQSQFLQEALDLEQLRVAVNSTNKTASGIVDPKKLPMNASLAAELFAYSMLASPFLFPWSDNPDFADEADKKKRYPNDTNLPDSVARVTGLLPPATQGADEMEQRKWFLNKVGTALSRKLGDDAKNTSKSDVLIEFSHVNVSSTVNFDAITIEFEIEPKSFTDFVDKKNKSIRYNKVIPYYQCGPWPMRCMMGKPLFVPDKDRAFDPPSQVVAFGSCVNRKRVEELTTTSADGIQYHLDCDTISNTSLMVISIGKRFEAESITENATVNASGYFDRGEGDVVVKNLRRIYTYTVARLSWNVTDLTNEFNAECATGTDSCQGLRFQLAPPAANPKQHQEIIVGVDALPTNLIIPPTFQFGPRFVTLVKLHEASSTTMSQPELYDAITGDPLLPHNMGAIKWDMNEPPVKNSSCQPYIEDRLQLILNNHMYIEHGLQTAYTAATFFLLQNGVVKDAVDINDEAQRKSLNFQQNRQTIALLASIPSQNAWRTLSGCIVLLLSLGSVVAWAWITSSNRTSRASLSHCGRLGHVTKPHVVARVMFDSVHFPPMFLHRRVIGAPHHDDSDDGKPAPTVEGFLIDGLTLQPPSDEKATL